MPDVLYILGQWGIRSGSLNSACQCLHDAEDCISCSPYKTQTQGPTNGSFGNQEAHGMMRVVFQNLVPGPPFAFGAVLVIMALIVAAFIPEHPSSSFRKLNPSSVLEMKKDPGETRFLPSPLPTVPLTPSHLKLVDAVY